MGYCYSDLSVQLSSIERLAYGFICDTVNEEVNITQQRHAPRHLEQPSQTPNHMHFSAHNFTFRSHQFSHPATIQNRSVFVAAYSVSTDSITVCTDPVVFSYLYLWRRCSRYSSSKLRARCGSVRGNVGVEDVRMRVGVKILIGEWG